MKRFPLFFCVCFLLLTSTAAFAGKKPILVCSTTQVADFARQIVGDRCEVRCILAPGADPHTYMPTPDDAKMVIGADLSLQSGLHLEGKNWMATLAKDANKPLITCTDGVAPIRLSKDGQTFPDPHAWFSVKNAAIYVRNILQGVISLDPDGKAQYEARARLYLRQLNALDGWIREQFDAISPAKRILVTSHDAFNYFCQEYKFNAQHEYLSLAPVGWSTGSEIGAGMTPERFATVAESVRKYGAAAVFVETSVNPKLIREIAKETGVKVGGTLYSDSMGERGSAGETYIGMMRENVLAICEALR